MGKTYADPGHTHIGDAIHAWQDVLNSQYDTRFCIFIYNPKNDAVEVYATGGHKDSSSREDCLKRVRDLYQSNIPCWGGYSFKSVKSHKAGSKLHHMRFAAFLLWPQYHHVEWHKFQGIQQVKNRVKTKVFGLADVFVEVHNFADVYGEDHWTKHQKASGNTALHCDFGGGDKISARPKKKRMSLADEIVEKSETMQRKKNSEYADELMEEERQRRMMELARLDVVAESERIVNQELASEAMEAQKRKYLKSDGKANVGSEGAAVRHSMLMKELFSETHQEHMDERTRRSHRREINDMVDAHHAEVIRQWNKNDDAADLRREMQKEKAFLQSQDEQERRCQDHEGEMDRAQQAKRLSAHIHTELCDCSHEMERKQHQKHAKREMDKEQIRRSDCNMSLDRDIHPDKAQVKRRSTMHEEIVKVVKIIQTHDSQGKVTTTTTTTTTTSSKKPKNKRRSAGSQYQ